jgi:hypothetical protein
MAFSKIASTTLSDDIISGKTALAEAPADTDELLLSDAGTLKRIDYSYLKSGGLVYIGGTSSTSEVSDLTVDNCFTSTYDNYIVKFGITIISGSNNTKLQMNFRTGGGSGSTESTSNYDRTGFFRDSQNNTAHTSDTGGSAYIMGFNALGNSDGRYTAEGTMQVFQPNSDTYYKTMITTAAGINWGGYTQTMDSICYHKSTTQMTGLVMHSTSGNLKFGWIKVYGVINS